MKILSLLVTLLATAPLFIHDIHAASRHNSIQQTSTESQVEDSLPSRERQFVLLCPICLENPVDTLLNPCHHITTCQTCSLKLDHCPQCRTAIQSRTAPVLIHFFTPPENLSEDPQSENFEPLCMTCKAQPINTLYTPCNHLASCHECALKARKCPECSERISKKIYPTYISFLPELKELDEEDPVQDLTRNLDSELELRKKLQSFIRSVGDAADLLAEIEKLSQSNDSFLRSGSEVVMRAQASAILSLGLELSVGCYTTSHFRGVPYIRLGFVSGWGLGGTVALSTREYAKKSLRPSPDFTSTRNDNAQVTSAILFGTAQQDLSLSSRAKQASHIKERGVALGFLGSGIERGRTMVRIPIFLPTQYFSKKGRLLLKAKKLEMKMIKLIRKNRWEKLYQDVLPEYQNTVDKLAERVRRKNSIYRSYRALPSDHPFHSLDNLFHATQKGSEKMDHREQK